MFLCTERIDPVPYHADLFHFHLRMACDALDARFDDRVVRRTLDVFDDEFRSCVVQLKTTCRPRGGMFYRFFYNGEKDLTAMAQRAGMLPSGASPLVDLQGQVLELFPGATRAGLDFEASFGLAKDWTFTGGPLPVAALDDVPAVPDAVRRHAEFFDDHGLKHVFFVASDYQQQSMNVYFGWEPECRSTEWLRTLIAETGGTADDLLLDEIVESLAVSAGIGMTFRWDRPEMGRWCVYGLELPYGLPTQRDSLPRLPTRLDRFRKAAPTLNREPQYNVAWSFGPFGPYVKLEKSYSRDATYFLTHEMGGDLRHLQLA